MGRSLTPDELCSLIEEHFPTLLLFARQFSRSGAEDIIQDAFLQLVRRCRWDGLPDQPIAWLFTVVRNAAIDQYRKTERQRRLGEELAANPSLRFEMPDDALVRSEEIDYMLESLPIRQREIVVARIWGSLSFDEIAALVNMSRTSVFRQYTEALETMRQNHGNKEN